MCRRISRTASSCRAVEQMNDGDRSGSTPMRWLEGARSRAAGAARCRRRRGARGRRCGAQHAARRCRSSDIDIATTARPDEVVRRREAAGFKAVPTGIEHGTVTVVVEGSPFEVTTCARTWRPTAVTPRSRSAVTGGAMPSGATSPSTRCRSPATARSTIMSAASPTSPPPRALHRRSGNAHRRGLSAHPAVLPLPCRLRPGRRRMRRALPPASPARDGLDRLSRERVRMEMIKLLVAPHAVPTLAVMAEAGLLLSGAGRRAAARELRATWSRSKRRSGLEARSDAPAGRARRVDRRGCRTACASACGWPMPSMSGLHAMADGWWRISTENAEQDGHAAALSAGAASGTPIGCCWHGPFAGQRH